MIKFVPLASGSSGNCVFLDYDGVKILIDCGLSGSKTGKLLEDIGEDPHELSAIFLTHEHHDHTTGVGVLSRRYDLPIYLTEGSRKGFEPSAGRIKEENIHFIKANEFLSFKNMDIRPFSIHHDAKDPVGFVFYLGNKKISLMTDTGFVDKKMEDEIKGSDIYYLEANHDLEALKRGPYPLALKKRVMGKMGHLSNDQTAEILSDLLEGRGEEVFLAHLSDTNNTPDLSRITVDDYLTSLGLNTRKDISLSVANRYRPEKIVRI